MSLQRMHIFPGAWPKLQEVVLHVRLLILGIRHRFPQFLPSA